jgi:hypothetical protein
MNCNCINPSKKRNSRQLLNYGHLTASLPILNNLDVEQCLECGIVFTPNYPQGPEEISIINKTLGVTFDTGKKRAEQKIQVVEKILNFAKIQDFGMVDVGGGAGHFCEFARSQGFQAYNFEPFSENTEEHILSDVAMKLSSSNIVLTMFHVLEHVVDPVSWIGSLVKDIKKDFENIYVLIEVPVIELETPFSDDPTPYYAPFHTRHFSIETARALLYSCGLEVIGEKAASDYNGYFFLTHHSHTKEVYQIDVYKEIELQDNYLGNRKNSMEFLRHSLEAASNGISCVVFWGAGIGYDFFIQQFGDIFKGIQSITVDKSTERQVREVESPEILRELFKIYESILIIPTSFAKSAEIIDEAASIAATEKYNSILYFDYINVRAY